MMKKKHINISIVTLTILLVFGCSTNEDDLMQPYVTGAVLPEITEVKSSFFDILDVNNAYIDFTVNTDMNLAESVTIEKTYKGNKSEIGTYTSMPVNINVTAEQAVADIDGVSVDDIELGDNFLFEVIVTSNTGLRTRSNVIMNAPVACKSDLGGTFTYSTTVTGVGDGGNIGGCNNPVTGEASFDEDGAGFYRVSDASFGQYDCAWGDTPAVGVTLTDVCNTLTIGGSDQYGLIYTFVIKSNDGTNLELEWSNDYGDKGISVLTRTGGKTWPLDLTIK
ncbi:MAG: hypothetical protein MI975_17055 [Cytophagales bacterium]|nr:hypothetical protein [Cytophagales bacterium]